MYRHQSQWMDEVKDIKPLINHYVLIVLEHNFHFILLGEIK